jgi:hypothetical protein
LRVAGRKLAPDTGQLALQRLELRFDGVQALVGILRAGRHGVEKAGHDRGGKGVVQSQVTRGIRQSRVDASRTDDGTLTFSGAVRDGSMCWRSGAAARE